MLTTIPANTLEKFTTFGDLLRFLRRRVGITQMELATITGYSDAQISRLEQNLRLPDLPTIEARFISALELENDHQASARLLDLAAQVRREDAPGLGLCPYKGLNYFDETDADLFVGRETLTAKLVERVQPLAYDPLVHKRRFLAIVGASGSGKSSLIRAGLIPALRWNKKSTDWHIHVFTPTAHPVGQLATSLTSENASVGTAVALMDDLAHDDRSLQIFARRKLGSKKSERLLLIIDQFEEIFTLCRSEEERSTLIRNLLMAASETDGHVIVIITLRADFYAHCASYIQLREALAENQEYIGSMDTEELRQAIEVPAQRGRWEFEPGLVELLLHDVGHEPGALPLLSHALLETWQRRRNRTMTLSGYASSGGVRGAITETAEAVFNDQFTREQQAIARRIFVRLTELTDETSVSDTRRRAKFDELILKPEDAPLTHDVLRKLADARLITTSEDSAEVAHEALIREWHTLRSWLEDNREALRLHRQLTDAAQEWQASSCEPDLLFRGVRLAQIREWVQTHAEELNPLEHEFLNASIELSEEEARERETQNRRELEAARKLAETEQHRAEEQTRSAKTLRVRNRVITVIGAAAIVLAILAGLFGRQSSNNAVTAAQNAQIAVNAQSTAQANAEIAEQSRADAEAQQRLATARELAASADNTLEVDPQLSILLGLQGVNATAPDGFTLPEVENALHRAIAASRVEKTFKGHDSWFYAMTFSPDGSLLATGGHDKTLNVWSTSAYKNILSLNPHDTDVNSVSFSPDGKRVATSGDDGMARIWDVTTGQLLLSLEHTSWVSTVAYSPDGKQIVTHGGDKTVKFWDAETGQNLKTWETEAEPTGWLSYSPDGQRVYFEDAGYLKAVDVSTNKEIYSIPTSDGILAISPDNKHIALKDATMTVIQIRDASNGELIFNTPHPGNYVETMKFSPDGSLLAISGRDRKIHIWNVNYGTEILTLVGHTEFIFSLAFSPDGKDLVSGAGDGSIKIWSLEPSSEVVTIPNGGFNRMALSPDGSRIAANGVSDPITGKLDLLQIWDSQTGKLIFKQVAHEGRGMAVAFSPDGKEIATGGSDQTLKIWDATRGKLILNLPVEDETIFGIAYRPDGKVLAAVGRSGVVRLYDRVTGETVQSWDPGLGSLSNVVFSPDGSRIAVVSYDTNDAKILDALSGKNLLTLKGHTNNNWGIDFNSDGTHLVTSGRDGTARLWDATTGKLVIKFTGHTSTIGAVQFSPDDAWIATVSADGTTRVWDALKGQQLLELDGTNGSVAFSPDGQHLIIPFNYDSIKIITLDINELVQIAKSRLTRTFTLEECQKYLHSDTCPSEP